MMDLVFNQFLTNNETLRISQYRDLAFVYDYDKDEIERIIKRTFLNKPFSKETLDNLVYYHTNIVQKMLNRKCAGLFSKDVLVSIYNDKEEIYINDFLNEYRFFLKLFELYKASKYFNTILMYANVIDGKLVFEILNGAECIVKNKDNYYEIDEISIFRSDKDKNVFILTWNENEVYKVIGSKIEPLFETTENPFGFIPISVLRDKEQNDFWGEPNWQLYYAQLFTIISKTDTIRGEFFQKFPILFGKNIDANQLKISPADAIGVTNIRPDVDVNLSFISPQVDWSNLRENDKYFKDDIAINEGLPASSTSLKAIQQSGYAKTIDEIELREQQMFDEWKLYYFIKDFIPKVLRVADYFGLIDRDIQTMINKPFNVDVKFNPTKTYESPQEIKVRREMEKQFMIKDEVDFIMEDLGLTEEEAINYLQKRLERADLISELKSKLEQEATDETEIPLIERIKQLI